MRDDRLRGIFNLKRLEKRRKEMRQHGTYAEALLWTYLRRRQLLGKKFPRQESIGPFIVDFYCPECRVIVELDGAPHEEILTGNYDSERTKYLEQYGMIVLRFENRLVKDNPEAVLETSRQALLKRSRQ
jgi:very-short-patch-repair endonuclease